MNALWQRPIARLRRRTLLSGALNGVGKVALPAMFAVLLYLSLCRLSPWARFLAPVSAAGLVSVLILAPILGAVFAWRSALYLAKWIDKTSGLEDRLASTVEWERLATRDPFQERCIDQFRLELGAGHWRLILPRTRPPRVLVTIGACLTMAGVIGFYLWQPMTALDREARQLVTLPKAVTVSAKNDLSNLRAEAHALADPELERMATDLSTLITNLDGGKIDRETTLSTLDRLRKEAKAVQGRVRAFADTSGPTGPLGALARALMSGDTEGGAQALGQLSRAVMAGELNVEDVQQLRSALTALGDLANGVDAAFAKNLHSAEHALAAGKFAEAGQLLAGAQAQFGALRPILAAQVAATKAQQTVSMLEHATQDPSSVAHKTNEADKETSLGSSGNPLLGDNEARGIQRATRYTDADLAEVPQTGPRLPVPAAISGKVLRELFESASKNATNQEIQQVVVAHRRVVEDRFRRDEIPEEYQAAVRAYFASLR
jgi:hypothetical protein